MTVTCNACGQKRPATRRWRSYVRNASPLSARLTAARPGMVTRFTPTVTRRQWPPGCWIAALRRSWIPHEVHNCRFSHGG